MSKLTLGSLFSGSGGFELGGILSGIEPKWASEIEPFPIRVTTKRMPFLKHLGDVNSIKGDEIEPVDIITFGSPCTNLSVAGKRSGLNGDQSKLFFQAIRIIKEMRCKTNGKYPRFIVWENVPGAFSSNHGEDFRTVLHEICKIKNERLDVPKSEKWSRSGEIVADEFSLAWRVFDAQFWGVPQRRKRIYLVADFASECSRKILFESDCVCWNSSQSLTSWQRFTRNIEESTSRTNKNVATLYENHGQDCRYKGPLNVAPTISSTYGNGGSNQPFVVDNFKVYDVKITSENNKKTRGNIYETEISRTIDTGGNTPNSNQGGLAIVCIDQGGGKSACNISEKNSPTLTCTHGGEPVVCVEKPIYAIDRESFNASKNFNRNVGINENGISSTLSASGPSAIAQPTFSMTTGCFTQINEEKSPTITARDYKDPPIVNQNYIVRRLTPTECARLQGFPDWWCSNLETVEPTYEEIEFWKKVFMQKGKSKSKKMIRKWLKNPHSDSAEYTMWGNGVCLNNVVFVLSSIAHYSQN